MLPLFQHNQQYFLSKINKQFPDPDLIFSRKNPVVIFPAARMGKIFLANLRKKGIPAAAFIDNNPSLQQKTINGLKIYSFPQAKARFINSPILVASLLYETPIVSQLRKEKFKYIFPLGFLNLLYPDIFISSEYHNTFSFLFTRSNQKKLKSMLALLKDKQSRQVLSNLIKYRISLNKKYILNSRSEISFYLDGRILPLGENEVFADCGGYDGDSIINFHRAVAGKFAKIYSFEPDRTNFAKLEKIAKKLDPKRIIPVKKGVYYKTGRIHFSESSTVDSHIVKDVRRISSGEDKGKLISINVASLDDFFRAKEVPTFIKMDIEGAEREALLGARTIIKKYKPKLAISIYHRSADLWDLPLLIRKLNSSYKLSIRHYSNEIVDTMLLAV